MKFFTKNGLVKKIIISILIVLVLIFSVPRVAYASWGLGGTLLKEILQLVASLGDVAMGLLNNVMLGADGIGSAMLPQKDVNIKNKKSWIYYGGEYKEGTEYDFRFNIGDSGDGEINTAAFWGTKFEIPNMLYSPENIFGNKIAALDVNFLRQNKYQAISDSEDAKQKATSAAGKLSKIIASWYKSFRNIAIVGLLSVLIYIGIRILISSTASDKAKYKENLKDWFMALCLVFIIHFIMSGILMLTDKVTELFSKEIDEGITVGVGGDSNIAFKTNLTGLIRFRAQSDDEEEVTAYTLVYVVLVFYTFRFTFIYFKRFLYMAFFTMIAPLVALTYPIDKMGDGKAQAFNIWFKEYTMNAIIQPVHLILYTVFVTSAMDLATDNIIYALVAIGFLIPAEKFIKKMFKLDQASSPSGLGAFAGGALAMKGLDKLGSIAEGKNSGNSSSSNSQNANAQKTKIKMQDRPTLGSFGGGSDSGTSGDNSSENQEDGARTDLHDRENNNEPIEGEEQENEDEGTPDIRENDMFSGQEEMDRLGEELDQYDNNDIYMNPELGEKQRRYQELDAEKRQWEEEQEQQKAQQEEERIRLEEQRRLEQEQEAHQENRPFENEIDTAGHNSEQQGSNDNIMDNKQEIPGWRRSLAKRVAVKARATTLKGMYKLARAGVKASAAIAGGAIGLAAGAATGDATKAFQYMGAGALAGKKIGNVVNRLPDDPYKAAMGAKDKVSNKIQGVKSFVNEERYGSGYAKQQEALANNATAKKGFMRDKQEERKYKEMAGRIYQKTGQNYTAKQLMNASFDYQQAGITDEEKIEKGLALEAKHGGINGENHDKMIDVMDFSTKYSRDSFTDSKKLAGLEGDVQSRVNGEKNQLEVMNLLAESYGVGDYYKKVGTIGKHNNQPTPNNPETANQQPRNGQPQNEPRRRRGPQPQNGSGGNGQPQPQNSPGGNGQPQPQNSPEGNGQPQPQNGPGGNGQPQSNEPRRRRGRPRNS